jgi:hypothetical protein
MENTYLVCGVRELGRQERKCGEGRGRGFGAGGEQGPGRKRLCRTNVQSTAEFCLCSPG